MWNLEELAPENPTYDGYDCSIPLESHTSGLVKGLVRDDVVNKLDALCLIWKTFLATYGLDFDVARIALSGNMKELGRSLGIDNGIKTYLGGVPLEDLLA